MKMNINNIRKSKGRGILIIEIRMEENIMNLKAVLRTSLNNFSRISRINLEMHKEINHNRTIKVHLNRIKGMNLMTFLKLEIIGMQSGTTKIKIIKVHLNSGKSSK